MYGLRTTEGAQLLFQQSFESRVRFVVDLVLAQNLKVPIRSFGPDSK